MNKETNPQQPNKPKVLKLTRPISDKAVVRNGAIIGEKVEAPVKKTRNRKSENARAVAREVLETVGKRRKVVLGKIIKKHGYTDSMAKSPKKVTETQAYKQEVAPVLQGMEKEVKLESLKTLMENLLQAFL